MTSQTVEAPGKVPTGWRIVGYVGEILITLGILLLLLVGYQLWWTNVEASRAAGSAASELRDSWKPAPGDDPADDGESQAEYVEPEFGEAFALMYIPRLSDSVWATPVVEGVQSSQLAKGIGHYPSTAMPGEVGNFAVAGHRATHGEPLKDVDRLREGDEVYVETRDAWFIYSLEKDQMVTPYDAWVIEPVPGDPGAIPTERLITLTTCHPRWASTSRWIWWGSLIDTIDKGSGEVPPEILEGP